jgi:hypothetical protein
MYKLIVKIMGMKLKLESVVFEKIVVAYHDFDNPITNPNLH